MNDLKKNKDITLLFIIITFAAVLRFWNYQEVPYMHDELSALSRTDFTTFSEMIEKGAKIDGHPAGVQTFLYYWTKHFGYDEKIVKFPFIVCGLLTILMCYVLFKRWFNATVAIITCSFMVAMQYTVLYSQICRPYAPGLLFSVTMVYCWTKLIFERENKLLWTLAYGSSIALCAYTHHMALLFAVIVAITGLFFLKKENIFFYFSAGILAIVLYLPHLSILTYQLQVGGVGGWLGKPEPGFLLAYFKYTLNYAWYVYLLIIALFVFCIYNYDKLAKEKNKFRVIGAVWFLTHFIIQHRYSIKISPVLQFSTLIFSFPFILVLPFSFVKELRQKKELLVSFVIIGFFTVALIYNREHYRVFYKQPFQQMALNSYKDLKDAQDDTKAIVNLEMRKFFLQHYLKKYHFKVNNTFLNIEDEKIKESDFLKNLYNPDKEYYLAGNLPLHYLERIKETFPYIKNKEEGFTYSYYCFSKKKEDDVIKEEIIYHENYDFEQKQFNEEYGQTVKKDLKALTNSRHALLVVGAKVVCKDSLVNPTLVVEIQENGKSIRWMGGDYNQYKKKNNDTTTIYVCHDLTSFKFKTYPNAIIKTYIWNKNKQNIFVSGITIEVRKYNPVIYGLYEPLD